MYKFNLIVLLSFLLCACRNESEQKNEKIFTLLDPLKTGVDFTNVVPENDTLSDYLYIYNGAGVAAGDINNDGLIDLFFTGNTTPAKLYLNKGNYKFEDVTTKAGITTKGWMTGVTMADVNNDGFLDIYVCKSGPSAKSAAMENLLFINNGNSTFTEKAKHFGVDNAGNSTCGTFFDFDADGDLDLYVGNHAKVYFDEINVKFTRNLNLDAQNMQHFYRNDGNKFTDISVQSGIKAMGYCLSATPGDFNNDGKTDIYVCNDYQIPDYFYINNGDGTFTESGSKYFKHTSANSMGSDAADFNNDGWLDLITVDMMPNDPRRFMLLEGAHNYDFFTMAINNGYGYQYMHNALQVSNGKGQFGDQGFLQGVARTDWSWCPLFADFDNDGNTDLYVTNGYYRDVTNQDFIVYQQRHLSQKKSKVKTKEILDLLPFEKLNNYMFKNSGNLHFESIAEDWGLDYATLSTGATYADLNNDGRMDLVVCNQGEKAQIFQNVGKKGNYLHIEFKGNSSNKNGLGCKAIVEHKGAVRLFELQTSHGYQSSAAPVLHIGAGDEKRLEKITLIWPNGKFQVLKDVKLNQLLKIEEKNASGKYDYSHKQEYTFEEVSKQCGLNFVHEDQENPDFKREPLLPHRFTDLGPGMATGDVNGDGLMDLLITNARESSGCKMYLQSESGKFSLANSQPWKGMNDVDVLGCLLFDADSDGDNDVYLVAGGAEYAWPSAKYKHRLYKNDGKGNFTDNSEVLPDVNCSGSCVTSADMDADGDLDLFVAGRISPGNYPSAPARSYLLRNDNGIFHDVTQDWAPVLMESPMLCAAVFADYNNDNKPDLILAGEWTPVIILQNMGNKFHDQTNNLGTKLYDGWYNSLLPVDIDNDGDLDILAGNKGGNSFVQASELEPLRIYSKDLDDNGRKDFWITYTRGEKEYPLYQLDEMASSYPGFIRKKFTTYADIANKSALEIFGPELMHKPLIARNFKSTLFRNDGDSFAFIPLPAIAQISPMYGTASADINNDGYLDILAIGNNFSPRVQHGRDDAANGWVFINNKGNLFGIDGGVNGMYVPGDGKSLVTLDIRGIGFAVVASENQGPLRVFKTGNKMQFVRAKKAENKALVKLKNGKTRIENVTYGGGYLSNSQPGVWTNAQVQSVTFVDGKGNRRLVLP